MRSSFVVAAAISLAAHATAVVYLAHYDAPIANQPQSDVNVMRISLAPRSKPAILEQQPSPETESPPAPAAVKRSRLSPVARQKAPQKPVSEPPLKSSETPETPELIEEQITALDNSEAPVRETALAVAEPQKERESYLSRLMTHIDNHKFYPHSARRHGIEGEIQVSFYLLRDGNISGLQATGESKVLRNAAKQAVQRALSLPPPPESMQLQEQIHFGMVYRLDG